MKKSEIVLAAASRYPRLAAATVRAWSELGIRRAGTPHWLLTALMRRTQTPARKTFRLEDGSTMLIDPFSYMGQLLIEFAAYEPETVAVFRAVVQRGMVVADIGANIGYHTVILARLVGRNGAVYAFEPDSENYQQLVANVRRNRCAQARCAAVALSATRGTQTLYVGEDNVNSSLRPNLHRGKLSVAVETTTLDAYVVSERLNRLDLLKIDVEGAERLVLEGGAHSVEKFRPMLVVELSVHSASFGYSARDLCSYLKSRAYTLFTIGTFPMHPLVDAPDDVEFCNVFAASSERVPALAARGIVSLEPMHE
jgi:FkbM family methyltransferase